MTTPSVLLSQTQELLSALESTTGVAPTTGWQKRKFVPGGVKGLAPILTKKADNRVDGTMQLKKGDVVGLDSSPSLTDLLCKDVMDTFGPGIVRAQEKFNGGGIRFYPTAVTTTQFTVAASGALTQGMLVYARGFSNAANNGLFLVQASSTSTAIKVTGTVAETVATTGQAIVEVVGFQFAAGDLQVDVNGNLTCTTADFTTFGLLPGQDVGIGGVLGGALVFATAAYRGPARVDTIAAKLLTLARRSWTVGAADTGATKTIQLLWGSFLRNVAITNADYYTPSWSLELTQPGTGTGGATQWIDSLGNTVKMTTFEAPSRDQVKVMIDFVGTFTGAPVDVRITGPSTATPAVAFAPINTATDEQWCKFLDLSENQISADVNAWKMTIGTNAAPRIVQGMLAAKDITQGDLEVKVEPTLFLAPYALQGAAFNNTTLQFTARFTNGDGAIVLDCPEGTITLNDPSAGQNGPVTVAATFIAHISAKYGHSVGITRFPYWPY